MHQYRYSGRNAAGKAVNGILEKADKNGVIEYLQKQDITPIKIDIYVEKTALNWQAIRQEFASQRVSHEQLMMFCRQMYTINKAGLPLTRGMKSLAMSTEDGVLRVIIEDIVNRLQAGVSLSVAMRNHPLVFDNLFISMVQVGEGSGHLDNVFLQLAYYIERDIQTKKSIKSAMRYPSFVVAAMVIAMVVINILVIPAFADMFKNFGAELPIPTRILIGVSNFFVDYWWLLLGLFILSTVAISYGLRTPEGKLLWHKRKLRLPIVGVLINKASLARYTRAFAVMLKAGVPLTEAIGLCARIIDNQYLFEKIEMIRSGIEHGDSLLRTHTRSEIFPPLILQMINIGEDSGQIDALLMDVAEFYDNEVAYDLKTLSAKIEPLLIVVMAGFVMILALGIFLPMWEMFNIQK